MRYLLVASNKEGSFIIHEDEVEKLVIAKQKNSPAIFREGVVLNWNMYAGLVPALERMREINEAKRQGRSAGVEESFFKGLMENKIFQINDGKSSAK